MEGGIQASVETVKVGVRSAGIGYCGTWLDLDVWVRFGIPRRIDRRGGLQDRLLDSRRQPVMNLAVQRLLERKSQKLTFAF
jgi:hypothetical protein